MQSYSLLKPVQLSLQVLRVLQTCHKLGGWQRVQGWGTVVRGWFRCGEGHFWVEKGQNRRGLGLGGVETPGDLHHILAPVPGLGSPTWVAHVCAT